ncbi:MAG: tol-pal system-associated acyl-CoA thioesterase [Acetobacteraceae bacterium]
MGEGTTHRYNVRVYFEDTDAGGIAYHAAHLRFAERARTEWLRALGVPHRQLIEEEGLIFVVKRLVIEYHRPARLDESLEVGTAVGALGGASVTLRQVIARDGEAIASLDVVLACVRHATGRPERIPERLRALFRATP